MLSCSLYHENRPFLKWGMLYNTDSEGESKTTIYDIINRSESGKPSNHQQGDGRPHKIFNQKAKIELKRLVTN